jgi:hypothetical protein
MFDSPDMAWVPDSSQDLRRQSEVLRTIDRIHDGTTRLQATIQSNIT